MSAHPARWSRLWAVSIGQVELAETLWRGIDRPDSGARGRRRGDFTGAGETSPGTHIRLRRIGSHFQCLPADRPELTGEEKRVCSHSPHPRLLAHRRGQAARGRDDRAGSGLGTRRIPPPSTNLRRRARSARDRPRVVKRTGAGRLADTRRHGNLDETSGQRQVIATLGESRDERPQPVSPRNPRGYTGTAARECVLQWSRRPLRSPEAQRQARPRP